MYMYTKTNHDSATGQTSCRNALTLNVFLKDRQTEGKETSRVANNAGLLMYS